MGSTPARYTLLCSRSRVDSESIVMSLLEPNIENVEVPVCDILSFIILFPSAISFSLRSMGSWKEFDKEEEEE